jgi:hypothetical protein
MHKINSPHATAENEFTDGDPASGIEATELWAKWFNSLQREVIGLLVATGITPSDTNDAQVLAAIQVLIGNANAYFGENSNGDPNMSDSALYLSSLVSSGSWVEVGPTGSGADVIWTAMDGIPIGARWIEVLVICNGSGTTTLPNACMARLHATRGGSTAGITDANQLAIAHVRAASTGDYVHRYTVTPNVKIPLSAGRRFRALWTGSFPDSNSIEMMFQGYQR